jgi:Cu2+-exporting ATPase
MQETLEHENGAKQGLRPCAHCGQPTFAADKESRVFCCNGCMGAYAMIHELGLEDFYALRRDAKPSLSVARNDRVAILNNLEAAGVAVHRFPDGLCSVRLAIDGVHCGACTWLIERVQPTIHGLKSAQVRMSDSTIELIYDPSQTNPASVSHRLSRIGYALSPWIANEEDERGFLEKQRWHWTGIATAAFLAANAMWIGVALYAGESTGMTSTQATFLRWIGTSLAILATVFPGRIFFQTAWQSIRTRTPHVDVPIALSLLMGAVGSLVGTISGQGHVYFDSLASLILLLRVGRFIQFRATYQSSLSVAKLLRLNSVVANRIEPDGAWTTLPSSRLKVGDRIYVQPGEPIPADGLVQGIADDDQTQLSSIDMSSLNGESKPMPVRAGDVVLNGTTNLSSPLTVQVTAVGDATRMGRLMELVREATTHRTPWIMAADRVGQWFVVVVIGLAVCTWLFWFVVVGSNTATQHTMALLTIACPCALALAAPLVLTVSLGRAAKRQIWIRDGNCLEKLATPGKMWLDKTGTLTHGRMTVLEWHGDSENLAHAARLESVLRHPVALAIVDFATRQNEANAIGFRADTAAAPKAVDVHVAMGRGIRGTIAGHTLCIGSQRWMLENGIEVAGPWSDLESGIHSRGRNSVWLAVDHSVVGMFGLGDPLREDTVSTLLSIAKRGWKLAILSGDRQEMVDRMAKALQSEGVLLETALGEQTPEQKMKAIVDCKEQTTGPCVMVGDGVNDAAALAVADVGIAIRGGSEQSLHAAPIYLANQRLSSVVGLLDTSKSVVVGIKRCFIASLIYNSITITLAITGLIHPLIAAILMPISGLTVLAMAMMVRSKY